MLQQYILKFLSFCYKVCTDDSECDAANCYFCSSNRTCAEYDHDYCEDNECGFGDGDCDPGQCKENFKCGHNNFHVIHPQLKVCTKTSGQEVCVYNDHYKECAEDSDCDIGYCYYCSSNKTCVMYDHGYCEDNDCGFGDGDCDDGQCKEDFKCGYNNIHKIHPKLNKCVAGTQDVCVYKDLGTMIKNCIWK